jgi:hypothetical protein
MKATLEFNLPEDRHEHIRAINAGTAWATLYSIDSQIRNALKYGLEREKNFQELCIEIRNEISEATLILGDE